MGTAKGSDVVIVGAGIIGCATSYYLAKAGCSVTVLEADATIGNGGSSRNGGGVRQSGRDPRELPLVMYGIEHLWPTLSEELGMEVEYYKKGNLRLGKTEADWKILNGLATRAQACGLDVRMIDGQEVRAIKPYLSEEVTCASWCPTDGHANPLLTTLAYYRAARRLGVRIFTGERVQALKKEKGRLRKVIATHGTYACDHAVLACGLGARPIAGTVGIDLPMEKVLLECLVTEAEPKMFEQMLGTAGADFYGHQTTHGSFVIGGSSGLEAVNKDDGRPVTHSITAPCICRGIIKYIPRLVNAKIVRTWAGWIDVMADKVPVIDKVEEVPGLTLACGFTGHGFGIAPAAALATARLVLGEEPPADISGLTYDRFHAKA